MTLYSDLTKDRHAINQGGEVQVFQIFELLCNLIDLRFEQANTKLERIEKGLIEQTDYSPKD